MSDLGPIWLLVIAAVVAWMAASIRSAWKSAENERPVTFQTNARQGSELARRILGDYVFNWGQSREVRINTLNRALRAAEIKCQVYTDKEGNMLYDAETKDEERRAINFRCGFFKADSEDGGVAHVDEWIETFRQRKDKRPLMPWETKT